MGPEKDRRLDREHHNPQNERDRNKLPDLPQVDTHTLTLTHTHTLTHRTNGYILRGEYKLGDKASVTIVGKSF